MKHQCHNVLLLMGNAETIAAIKQSLLLEPTSTKPVLDFSLLLPPPQTLQQAKRNHAFVQQLKRWRTHCQRQFKFDPFGYEFGNLNLTPIS